MSTKVPTKWLLVLVAVISASSRAGAAEWQSMDSDDFFGSNLTAILNFDAHSLDAASSALYKQPSGSFVQILREFFNDIDWVTIGRARDQIELFVRKVNLLIRSYRGKGREERSDDRLYSGRLFGFGSKKDPASGEASDGAKTKEMLNKVACFLGYMRLLNYSNEALAELDAAKTIVNFFNNGKTSTGSHWFG